MTRAELERRLKLHLISLAAAGMSGAAHDRAGNIEIAREILLDELEKIVREVQMNTISEISRSVVRRA